MKQHVHLTEDDLLTLVARRCELVNRKAAANEDTAADYQMIGLLIEVRDAGEPYVLTGGGDDPA